MGVRILSAKIKEPARRTASVISRLPMSADTTQVMEQTELGQSIKELNDDTVDQSRRVSGIDMRSRLHPFDISSILVSDTLVVLGAQPIIALDITGKKKRLSVSENGLGRTEIKDMTIGKREFDRTKGEKEVKTI